MSIALDTNRLIKPTQRRFNGAWFESDEQRIQILPQTATELTNGKFAGDLESAIRFARETLQNVLRRGDLETAFKVRCDLWWMDAFKDTSPLYELVKLSPSQYQQARALREALPRRAFPGVDEHGVHESKDMLLVSQAMVTSQKLLITSDGKSIKSAIINDWLYRHGNEFGTDSKPLVFIQDETIKTLFEDREEELLYIVLGASWPMNEYAHTEECIEQFESHCHAMKGALLENTAIIAKRQWDDIAEDVEILLNHVRVHYLPKESRAHERRHPANEAAPIDHSRS